jgi:3-dehydroquinate dehydratase-2
MKTLLVINGPNLNLLGVREQEIYGEKSLEDIQGELTKRCRGAKIRLEFFQSNSEGEIINTIHSARGKCDCIIINPGGYTHTSVSIRDALAAAEIPVIEVHLSNVYAREEFRQKSFIAPIARGQISGFGWYSYILAFDAAQAILKRMI